MEEIKDTYRTIERSFEGEVYKAKGSKFIGYTFFVENENNIEKYIKQLKSKHHKARHWCYAWRLGTEKMRFRVNDDGEPNNSAGQPIYGQILSKDVTNILIIVVRYFGGTKLGVGGLISAYKIAAQFVLDKSIIISKTINLEYNISFEYKDLDKVLRIIRENKMDILSQKMEYNCEFVISVRKNNAKKARFALDNLRCIQFNEN